MRKQNVFIFLFFLNLLIHNAYAYNLKQVADKNICLTVLLHLCARMNVD